MIIIIWISTLSISTLPISTLGSGPGDELQHSPPVPGAQDGDQTHLEVSTLYLHNIYTISTLYLHNIYTISTLHLHNIHKISTHFLNNIYCRSCVDMGTGCLENISNTIRWNRVGFSFKIRGPKQILLTFIWVKINFWILWLWFFHLFSTNSFHFLC